FNHAAKLSARTIDLWTEILRRIPPAQLLLRNAGLDQPELQDRVRTQFLERNVAPERIVMEGWVPQRELLTHYNRVDLALDTQPYSGGLTTCEALWMGVPVVTLPGKTFAGRHSTSHMTNAGYEQFVAADLAGYIELAVQWAQKPDELAHLRSEMRERVAKSPLCDAPRFARDFLKVLRGAWQSHGAEKSA